jgi:hypothetical protein
MLFATAIMDQQYEQDHERLARINTEAVSLMLEGRQDEALEKLQLYLEWAQRQAVRTTTVDLCTVPTVQESTCIYEVSLEEVIYPFDSSERVSPDNCFRFHRNLFATDSVQGATPGDALRKTMAVVAYNLAVIYHECGIACVNRRLLCRALHMYNAAATILGPRHVGGSSDLAMIPLVMALHNNLGHVHAFFGNRDCASACCLGLKTLLSKTSATTLECAAYAFSHSTLLPQSYLNKAPAA